MKKTLKFFPILLMAILGLSLASCSDDDEPISANELPATAQAFIATYYPDATVRSAQIDSDEYDVLLSDGTSIEFNLSGVWQSVDAPFGQTVPSGFYPENIDIYLEMNMPGAGINEINKETQGYDVELIDGTDLLFGWDGNFIGYDTF